MAGDARYDSHHGRRRWMRAPPTRRSASLDRNVGCSSEGTQRADTAVLMWVEEVPATHVENPPSVGRACAMRLRDTTDGREYLLRKSWVETKTHEGSATVTTQLERAVGDYDVIGRSPAEPKKPAPPRRLRNGTGGGAGWSRGVSWRVT
jgi:hypothetical protein